MNRRNFLKAAVAIPVAAAAPAGVARGLGAMAGSAGGLMGASGVLAETAACVPASTNLAMGALASSAWAALRLERERSAARLAFYEVYRRHRIAVRMGKSERLPARVIWLQQKLLGARRGKANNDQGIWPSRPQQFGARSKRFAHHRIYAREMTAIRAKGFKLPWEYHY